MNNSLIWKRRLGSLCCCLHGNQKIPRRVVLLYHAVGTGPKALACDVFARQMEWLNQHAVVVSLEDFFAGKERSGLQVAITFDDGYRCLYSTVTPELERWGFPATAYINPNLVEETIRRQSDPHLGHYAGEEFLLWDEIGDMASRGWTIGSHGMDHVDLTGLEEAKVIAQLTTSRDSIEKRVGRPCDHFAYTWGHHSADVRRAVKLAGYRDAAAAHHAPLSDSDDAFALPRVDIRKEYELQDFIATVSGRWDFLGVFQKLKRIAG